MAGPLKGGLLVPSPNRWRRTLRLVAATLVVILLAISMSATGLFFLLRGDAIENSVLTRNIESAIQKLVGPQYEVKLGPTYFGFDPDGLLSLESTKVNILRASDRQVVSSLGKIIVGIKPLSILSGAPAIDAVIVEDSILDAALLPFALGATAPDIASVLGGIGARLGKAQEEFSSGRFRLFQFRNVIVEGAGLGRIEEGPVRLTKLDLRFRRNKNLQMSAGIVSDQSTVELRGSYEPREGGGRQLNLKIAGLNMREWAQDPGGNDGMFGSDAIVEITGNVPFGPQGEPLDAALQLSTAGSSLRLGLEAVTDLHELVVSLKLRPGLNDIAIEPSRMLAGAIRSDFAGVARPQEGSDWVKGPIAFNLAVSPITPTTNGEEGVPASIDIEGGFIAQSRRLDLSRVSAIAGNDSIAGSASFVFNGVTPALTASFKADGLDVAAVKQYWPFFIAPPARAWAHRSISGGRLSGIELAMDLPPGVLGRLRRGARMAPEEYEIKAGFSGVRIASFGELPAIENGAGDILMKGMSVEARLSSGVSGMDEVGEIPVESGSFRIADIGIRPNIAEVRITTSGPMKSLAAIAEAKPLSVMSRLKLTPQMVSGTAAADVVARFPLKRGITYEEVDWNVIADLKKAASTGKLFNRTVGNADVLVDANPQQVRVNGTATVDGTRTKLAMVEPIGDSDVARERLISAELDEAARKKMGLALDPVLTGTIKVDLRQAEDGVEKQTIDLRNAVLNLPWVGWTKGKGIPAKATFAMRTEKGITRLDDFYIEGDGFSAVGKLTLDKSGLLSADFVNISLNQDDSFSLKLERKGRNYNIAASGLRYDGRALINRLFHEKGFGEEQGDSTMTVTANLGEVRGYNGKVLRNVELIYGAKGGWLDQMTLRGLFDDTDINVFANTKDGSTTFEIDTGNAGNALAFVDIYRKMQGGNLRASLKRTGSGPFTGPVRATGFTVTDEPRIKMLVNDSSAQSGAPNREITTQLKRLDTNRVRFQEARGRIEKGDGYFRVEDGVINNAQIGFTFDGSLYNKEGRMDLSGTFLPVIGLSRAIGYIPLVGDILGNGRDSGLFGITYRLSGPARNPNIEINPVSMVAPGIFRKIFEYQKEQN